MQHFILSGVYCWSLWCDRWAAILRPRSSVVACVFRHIVRTRIRLYPTSVFGRQDFYSSTRHKWTSESVRAIPTSKSQQAKSCRCAVTVSRSRIIFECSGVLLYTPNHKSYLCAERVVVDHTLCNGASRQSMPHH
jgi:hypothetical protein